MKLKILIADDDSLSRRMLKSTLERTGYDVIAVEDGTAATEALCEQNGPRLALLDWMMPGVDGPGVVRMVRVRRGQQYVHMILLTSRQSKEDVVAGLDAGADDYLTKPFNPQAHGFMESRRHYGTFAKGIAPWAPGPTRGKRYLITGRHRSLQACERHIRSRSRRRGAVYRRKAAYGLCAKLRCRQPVWWRGISPGIARM